PRGRSGHEPDDPNRARAPRPAHPARGLGGVVGDGLQQQCPLEDRPVNLPAIRTRTISFVLPLLVVGCGSGAPAPVASPATTPSPPASQFLTPSPSIRLRTQAPSPTPLPEPVDSTVDGVAVRTLERGPLSAPIDVVVAFGSVWVANHHGDSVTRVDPSCVTSLATIQTGTWPGWFAVAEDAVWVSTQNSVGMTRVDP